MADPPPPLALSITSASPNPSATLWFWGARTGSPLAGSDPKGAHQMLRHRCTAGNNQPAETRWLSTSLSLCLCVRPLPRPPHPKRWGDSRPVPQHPHLDDP